MLRIIFLWGFFLLYLSNPVIGSFSENPIDDFIPQDEDIAKYEIFAEFGHINFSPDGNYLACGGEDGSIGLWEVSRGKEVRKIEGHIGRVTSVSFLPDGKYIISGGKDKKVNLWYKQWGRDKYI